MAALRRLSCAVRKQASETTKTLVDGCCVEDCVELSGAGSFFDGTYTQVRHHSTH